LGGLDWASAGGCALAACLSGVRVSVPA